MYLSTKGLDLDKDAQALAWAAMYLDGASGRSFPPTRSLAITALGDPAIAAWWRLRGGRTLAQLEKELEAIPPTHGDRRSEGSFLARALGRAVRRHRSADTASWIERLTRLPRRVRSGVWASGPEITLSRGDLLYGLAHVPSLKRHFEGTTTGFYGALDAEERPPGDRVIDPSRDDVTRASVVVRNDDVTHMDQVMRVLTEGLGWSRTRAAVLMARVHGVGVARVVVGPIDEARRTLTRLRSVARTVAPTLCIECVAE